MKELHASVTDIEQSEESRTYYGHGQQISMMLRQGKTDEG
jgi:hypothetical protein